MPPGKPTHFPQGPATTGLVALWWIWLFLSKEEPLLCPHGLAALPCLQGIALDQAESTCCPHTPAKRSPLEIQTGLEQVSQGHTDKADSLLAEPGIEENFQAQLDHQSQEVQSPSKWQSSVLAVSPATTPSAALQPLWKALHPLCSRERCPQPPTVPFPVPFPSLPPALLYEDALGLAKPVAYRSPFSEWQAAPTLARSVLQRDSTLRPAAHTSTGLPAPRLSPRAAACLTSLPKPRPSARQSPATGSCAGQVRGSLGTITGHWWGKSYLEGLGPGWRS